MLTKQAEGGGAPHAALGEGNTKQMLKCILREVGNGRNIYIIWEIHIMILQYRLNASISSC